MDLEYLQNEVLPIRAQEIKDGKNLITAQPIYVVYVLDEHICGGHDDYINNTNHHSKEPEYGYMDLDADEGEFCYHTKGLKTPAEITRFWIDRAVAFFLTSEAAHANLKYQGHNLTKGYVYVHSTGYSNYQMDAL